MTQTKRSQALSVDQKPLKVVHLCATDTGGAGRAAARLHRALQAEGVDSLLMVVSSKSTDPSVRIIPSAESYPPPIGTERMAPHEQHSIRTWQHWHSILADYPDFDRQMEVFTDDYSEIRLETIPEIREADIVNLHWVPGIFNALKGAVALKGKKVVWTMHDMNPFTGGCHYAGSCTRYLEGCGACPTLGSREEGDISHSVHAHKSYAYGKLDLHPVAPSRWLAECASRSSALSPFPTTVIPNSVPTDVYAPSARREEIRAGFGVPEGAKVVLFGADVLTNRRKGFAYLFEALKRLQRRDIFFAFFGKLPKEMQLAMDLPFINIGHVSDEETLAAIYSMADLFIIPSLEDNLPNTVVESMACGVPVLGFDVGGIPDMVEHKRTGFLARAKDIEGLIEGINWCLFEADGAALSRNCREKALSLYAPEVQARNYLSFYREILAHDQVKGPEILIRTTPPKISIVTPSYNQAPYLEACLDSVLSQNYPNLEYIVMDGGSSDGSAQIIRKYEKHLAYWQSRPDGGQYHAVNDGFRRSTGEIMGWLNSDDMLHPGGLLVLAEVFSRLPQVELLTGRRVGFDGKGNVKYYGSETQSWCRDLLLNKETIHQRSLFIMQEGTYWKRSLWERCGATLDLNCQFAADFELWLRFSRHAQLHTVNALIGGFRDHSTEQRCHSGRDSYLAECEAVIERELEIPASVPTSPAPAVIPHPVAEGKPQLLIRVPERPKISIVTPSYNQASYLEECLDSVLSQNYPNLEYIVMDGGSSDGSVEIIKKYQKHLAYWQSRPDGGQYRAVNAGFDRSSGEVMAWLNSDDKYHPGALWLVADAFRAFPAVEWVMGNPTLFDESGVASAFSAEPPAWCREKYLRGAYHSPYIQQESVFWRRSLWEKAGAALDTSFELAADMELWARFFRHARLHTLNAPLAGFRTHDDQKSALMRIEYHREADRVVERERKLYPASGPALEGAPQPLHLEQVAEWVEAPITPDNFGFFAYSRKIHFPFLRRFMQELYRQEIPPCSCDVLMYQELLAYAFIRQNVPAGGRILQLGREEAPVLEALKGEYRCWHLAAEAGIEESAGVTRIAGAIGEFVRELPDGSFDFIFSTGTLEPARQEDALFQRIRKDIERLLAPQGVVLNSFEIIGKGGELISGALLPYLFRHVRAMHRLAPFQEANLDPYVFTMTRQAYDTYRKPLTGIPLEEFGFPISYNILWRAAEKGAQAQQAQQVLPARPARPVHRGEAPRISLVIPSYNYAQYLEACLGSILSQGYPNLELIVMDGGSTDGTVEIIKKHERYLSHWQSAPDAGQYSAINEGFGLSTGEIMGWLNADDMFHPGAFETVSAIFSENEEVQWIMGRPNSFDETGKQKGILPYLPLNTRARYLADEEFIQQEGVFWRRPLWERAGSHIRTDMKLAADLELWARFFRHAPLHAVDALIAGFRDHPLQKSKDKAGYTAEANLVLARERELFAQEGRPYSPPAPLPILVSQKDAA